ncbi:kinase-regulated stress-responsive transcription factor skn7 [Mycoemilia scoparia]|uniref:Kinase-regulated stress-responsive transcription factor skn7 n=1 Tax=Mycoemilia scoparia TaxID=417184 RepID=A0A9W8DPE2_9FUNG|nr:kinase-regulated stress-responsive transcription factor skn7 [Mycoemilia scoparia]
MSRTSPNRSSVLNTMRSTTSTAAATTTTTGNTSGRPGGAASANSSGSKNRLGAAKLSNSNTAATKSIIGDLTDPLEFLQMATGVPEFVKKLFRMLETKAHQDIVCWSYEGDSFVIKEPNEFSKHILPQHFKHNNFASFVRQLNKYDFHKIKQPNDAERYGDQAWKFHHPFFQHDKHELLEKIKRKVPPKSRASASAANNSMSQNDDIRNAAAAAAAAAAYHHTNGGSTSVGGFNNIAFLRGNGIEIGRRSSSSNSSTTSGDFSSLPANEMDLRYLTQELQAQMHMLAQSHSEMSLYINELNRSQQQIFQEVVNLKKNIQVQDQVIGELIQYSFGSNSGGGGGGGMNSSNNISSNGGASERAQHGQNHSHSTQQGNSNMEIISSSNASAQQALNDILQLNDSLMHIDGGAGGSVEGSIQKNGNGSGGAKTAASMASANGYDHHNHHNHTSSNSLSLIHGQPMSTTTAAADNGGNSIADIFSTTTTNGANKRAHTDPHQLHHHHHHQQQQQYRLVSNGHNNHHHGSNTNDNLIPNTQTIFDQLAAASTTTSFGAMMQSDGSTGNISSTSIAPEEGGGGRVSVTAAAEAATTALLNDAIF